MHGCYVMDRSKEALLDTVFARLRNEYCVYVPLDGRMNVAGLSVSNVDRAADHILAALEGT